MMVELEFRETRLPEVWRRMHGDVPVPSEVLRLTGWECLHGSRVVGHCTPDVATGEILLLSVDHSHRRQGIARKLLALLVERLHAEGVHRVWLAASRDTTLPAYQFYRALGWRSTGERLACGDETLEFPGGGSAQQ